MFYYVLPGSVFSNPRFKTKVLLNLGLESYVIRNVGYNDNNIKKCYPKIGDKLIKILKS